MHQPEEDRHCRKDQPRHTVQEPTPQNVTSEKKVRKSCKVTESDTFTLSKIVFSAGPGVPKVLLIPLFKLCDIVMLKITLNRAAFTAVNKLCVSRSVDKLHSVPAEEPYLRLGMHDPIFSRSISVIIPPEYLIDVTLGLCFEQRLYVFCKLRRYSFIRIDKNRPEVRAFVRSKLPLPVRTRPLVIEKLISILTAYLFGLISATGVDNNYFIRPFDRFQALTDAILFILRNDNNRKLFYFSFLRWEMSSDAASNARSTVIA